MPARCLLAITAAAIALPAVGAAAASAPPVLMQRLIGVLNSGDQPAFERFVRQTYAPGALAEMPAEVQADRLARLFADTGGFELDAAPRSEGGALMAEAHDRTTGIRYCLKLQTSGEAAAERVAGFTAQALYPAGPTLSDPSATEVSGSIRAFAEAYARRGLFSGVVLVAKEGRVVFEKAYGQASIAYGAPMTTHTRLNVASIGKSLTGVAIAQLVERGLLSYDATVGQVLPDFPNAEVRNRVTVRQLLSHTSGLGPDDYYDLPDWPAARPGLRTVADYMKLAVKVKLGGKPGEFLYSNAGYVILGAMIEKVSGQRYDVYVADHIFKPAGMSHSLFHELDAQDRDVATPLTNLFDGRGGYIFRLGRPRDATYQLAARGGPQGGAYMTAEDLLAFEEALQRGRLVRPATFARMLEPVSPAGAGAGGLSGDVREGLGLEVVRQNGHTFYGHTGGDLGVASFVYWYPDSGLTTVALTNGDPRAARVLTNMSRALITRRTIGGATPPPQRCPAA